MPKIVKAEGWCSDGFQWVFCDYWLYTEEEGKPTKHECTLFIGEEKNSSHSLKICNKLFGTYFEGHFP